MSGVKFALPVVISFKISIFALADTACKYASLLDNGCD